MSCLISSGYNSAGICKVPAGIETIYMIPRQYISGYFTYDVNNVITLISQIGQNKFYQYDVKQQTADFSEKFVKDTKTGLFYFDGTLTIQFNKNGYALREQLYEFIYTQKFCIIFKTNSNKYFLIGKTYGVTLEEGDITFGKKYGDLDGHILKLKNRDKECAQEVKLSAFTINTTQRIFNPNLFQYPTGGA